MSSFILLQHRHVGNNVAYNTRYKYKIISNIIFLKNPLQTLIVAYAQNNNIITQIHILYNLT